VGRKLENPDDAASHVNATAEGKAETPSE